MSNHESATDMSGMWRWIGGLGVVYAVLYLTGFLVLTGSEPSISASPSRVVSYYAAHQGTGTAGVLVIVLASIAFAFFAGAVRTRITANNSGARHLSAVITTGAAVYASGLLVLAATRIALLDAAHHNQPAVAQVVNYLGEDDFFPMVAGLAIFLLATGIAIVRTSALPAWLGWFAVVVGVLAAAGPLGAVAVVIAPIWTLVASVVLLTRKEPSARAMTASPMVAQPVHS